MRTSVARPFDVIAGSPSKPCLSTECRRREPSPDLNGAADASPGTQTCGTPAAARGSLRGPSLTGLRCFHGGTYC